MRTGRRVLVASPAFHGYLYAVGEALMHRGYDVIPYAYDRLPLTGKVVSRVSIEARRWWAAPNHPTGMSGRLDERAAAVVQRSRPDAAIIIRGDELGSRFWDALDALAVPRIVWLYDSLDRMTWTAEDLASRGPVASYSRSDVAGLTAAGARASFLPVGFDATLVRRPVPSNEVVMIGERYSNREDALRSLRDAGLEVRAYGRTWSRDWRDRRPWRATPQHDLPWGRQISRQAALGIMAGAPVTLNLHGPSNEFGDGLSTRTFEASGAGAFQITDRLEVAEFFEPGREVEVCVDPAQLTDIVRRALRDRAWAEGMGRRAQARTLAEHTFDRRVIALEQAWALPD